MNRFLGKCAINTTMKPHIAVLPSHVLGHIIPLLEFSKRLVLHNNFHVSFLVITASDDSSSSARAQLLNAALLPPDLDIVYLPLVDVDKVVDCDAHVLTRICAVTEESIKALKSILVGLDRPKALIVDMFCSQAFDVGRELSIPVYSFWTSSVSFLAFSMYFVELDRTIDGNLGDLLEPVRVPDCSPVKIEDLVDQIRVRNTDEYKWFLFHMSRLSSASGIFINSYEDLEPVPLKAIRENQFFKESTPPVYPIGPIMKQDQETEPTQYSSWLDAQPPDSVLFVALGSGGTLSTEQMTELAWGLELSRQRFIWVVRKPNDATTSGSDANNPNEYLPQGFLEGTQGVGVVVPSWTSQVAVLRHPSTGGFLSHCGWNSTLESIVHGVPMIAWPLYAEQNMNATVLVEDIGVAVRPTTVDRVEIERVVRMVMEGEEGKVLRRRVRELKESALKAVDVGGSSNQSLLSAVQGWKDDSSNTV